MIFVCSIGRLCHLGLTANLHICKEARAYHRKHGASIENIPKKTAEASLFTSNNYNGRDEN